MTLVYLNRLQGPVCFSCKKMFSGWIPNTPIFIDCFLLSQYRQLSVSRFMLLAHAVLFLSSHVHHPPHRYLGDRASLLEAPELLSFALPSRSYKGIVVDLEPWSHLLLPCYCGTQAAFAAIRIKPLSTLQLNFSFCFLCGIFVSFFYCNVILCIFVLVVHSEPSLARFVPTDTAEIVHGHADALCRSACRRRVAHGAADGGRRGGESFNLKI